MNHIDTPLETTREPTPGTVYGRTIEDVLRAVDDLPGLAPRTKSDYKSALRTLAKAIGQLPNAIPANPPAITRRLKNFKAAELGLKPASWNNALSISRKALKATGCFVAPGAYNTPLTPAWTALAEKIKGNALRYGISRLMHVASENGWQPEDISDDHFDRYQVELETRLACKSSQREAKRTRQLWNQAVRTVPEWPTALVRTVNSPGGYCFPWSAFPASLKGQVDAYCAKRSTSDLFAKDAAKPLSPRTLTDNEFKVRQFASGLVRSGVKIESLAHLKDLLDPERLQSGFRFFLERSNGQVTTQIIGIACALASVAQWGSGMSNEELAAAIEILNKVRRDETGRSRGRRAGMTAKNKDLLRQFDDPANVAKIVYAADILCEGLPLQGPLSVRQAQIVRTALMIELLLVFPIREANLASLRLGQHIQWSQPGRRGVVSIYIQPAEVKNDQDLEVQLPARTTRLLEYYLKHALPLLGDPTAPWLFPGQKGHLHSRAMGEQFKRVMKSALGLRLNLHFTRHLCAKLYLDRNPGQYAIIQYALGHKKIETTMKFYAEFSSVAALKLVDDNLLDLRAELAHLAPLRRRRRGK
jgi:integrase